MELRTTMVDLVAPDEEEVKLKVTTNFEVTTEEELWTTAGLEVMTDGGEG